MLPSGVVQPLGPTPQSDLATQGPSQIRRIWDPAQRPSHATAKTSVSRHGSWARN
jgi:hypothetical protein